MKTNYNETQKGAIKSIEILIRLNMNNIYSTKLGDTQKEHYKGHIKNLWAQRRYLQSIFNIINATQ